MATLTVQDVPVLGLSPIVFDAADASLTDDVATGAGVALLVRNDDTVSHTATIDTPGTVRGLQIQNPDLVVAAGDLAIIRLASQVFGASAVITYDDVTSLFVAAVKLAR